MRLKIDAINHSLGVVKAIICNGNRNNQAFFRLFDTEPQQPWLTKGGIYLLNDFVYLLTEKMEELAFYEGLMKNGVIARWSHLLELLKLETEGLAKMSKLTKVSVYPKPIERQSVPTCLRVFCEKTYTAIINDSGMKNVDGCEHTAAFIRIVVNWWKKLNIKSIDVGVRFNKKLQAVVQDPLDEKLNTILQFGEMALQMKAGHGNRYKQFTRVTNQKIRHTCNGIVILCRSLLRVSHNHVLMGILSTDPLEKKYGKLGQGSGGTYFITVQHYRKGEHIQGFFIAVN